MNLLQRHRVLGGLVVALALLVPALAWASVPPAKVVEARLASAREAASDLDVDIEIEMTGEDTAGISSFATLGKRASAGGADVFPWKLLMVVLTSSDPWSDIETLTGSVDPSITDIDTQDDAFIYAYGDNPQIAVSRDLAVIRRVQVGLDMTRWELVTEGRLEDTPMPERIVVLKDGRPIARVALSLPEAE